MTHVLRCAIAILCIASAPPLRAQSESAARPQFEVASVKPNKSGEPGLRLDIQPGGRFIAINIPLKQMIRAAYTLQLFQIVGAPAWVDAERFDVSAIADRDITVTTPWTPGGKFALVQLMLQSLLTDRFKMVVHSNTRESQVYALIVDKAEPGARDKLRSAAPDCAPSCGMRIGPGTLTARNVPLPQLAELLSQLTGRLAADATGLTGSFDMELRWSPDLQQQEATDAPSIFTALREQLGLRLETVRGPVPVLVIDSIERPTSSHRGSLFERSPTTTARGGACSAISWRRGSWLQEPSYTAAMGRSGSGPMTFLTRRPRARSSSRRPTWPISDGGPHCRSARAVLVV